MLRDRSTMRRLATSLLLGPALLLVALAVPAGVAAAGPVTSSACTPTGPAAVTCDLWAKTGTLALAGHLDADLGLQRPRRQRRIGAGPGAHREQRRRRHRQPDQPALGRPTSILFDGQPMVPDLTGVAARRDEGLRLHRRRARHVPVRGRPPARHAVPGGEGPLRGPDRPPAGEPFQAYDDASTAFADEALWSSARSTRR